MHKIQNIVFLHTGEMVLTQLLDWLRWHFPGVHQLAQDVLNDDQPDSNNNYWEAVSDLVCDQGVFVY